MVGSKEDFRNSAESNSADSSAWDSLSDTKFGSEAANESSAESENTVEKRNSKIGGKLFGIYKRLLNKMSKSELSNGDALSKSELSNGDALDAGYGTADDNVGGDRDTSVNSKYDVFNAALDAGYGTIEDGASLDVEVNDALDAGYDIMDNNVGGDRDTSVNSEYASRAVEGGTSLDVGDGASLDVGNGAVETVRITGDSSNDNFFVNQGEPTDLGSYIKRQEYGYPDNPGDRPDYPNNPDTPENPDDMPDYPDAPEDPGALDGSNNPLDPSIFEGASVDSNYRQDQEGTSLDRPDYPDNPDTPDNPDMPDYPDAPDSPEDPLNLSAFEDTSVDSSYRQAQEGTFLDDEGRTSSVFEDGAALDVEDGMADGNGWGAEDNTFNDGSFESVSMDSAEKIAVEADTESSEHEDIRARAKAIRERTKAEARATYDMWMEQADRMEKHDPANADSIRRIANVFKHRAEERLGEKI